MCLFVSYTVVFHHTHIYNILAFFFIISLNLSSLVLYISMIDFWVTLSYFAFPFLYPFSVSLLLQWVYLFITHQSVYLCIVLRTKTRAFPCQKNTLLWGYTSNLSTFTKISMLSLNFLSSPDWPWTCNPSASISHIVEMTGLCHQGSSKDTLEAPA